MQAVEASTRRPRIAVACGVLRNKCGEVLIAQRPAGKIAAGKWEFPGGKIEHGESPREALLRELHEELGISITGARPLILLTHDYAERTVMLDTWLVESWNGEPQGREGQALAWCRPERLWDYDLLAADGPIVNALRLPCDYVFTPPDIPATALLNGLEHLPAGALLRLRLPGLSDADYETLAREVIARARVQGLHVMLDRELQQVLALGAAGWHCSSPRIAQFATRPLPADLWLCGSTHDAAQLQQLGKLGADCAVLGPVLATSSHPGQAGLGWERFAALSAHAGLPVYAIGGVGPQQQALAQTHHAQGTAGISAYWEGSRSLP